MEPSNKAFGVPSSDTSRQFRTLHYLIIAAVIPTFAFDIPVAAIQGNPGCILGVIIVGISGILSIYRSGLLARKRSRGQSYEYQVLLSEQDTLERGASNVRAGVGKVGQTEKTFFTLVDFLFASVLLVATVLLYVGHGRDQQSWRRGYEDSAMIVIKTWGSLPLCLVCLIHTYLFSHAAIQSIMTSSKKSAPICTRCQGPLGENPPPPSELITARSSMESVGPEMASIV